MYYDCLSVINCGFWYFDFVIYVRKFLNNFRCIVVFDFKCVIFGKGVWCVDGGLWIY